MWIGVFYTVDKRLLLGEEMNFIVLAILICCALGLYAQKYLVELHQKGILKKKLEHAAQKALRFALLGLAAVGFVCVALYMFPTVRQIGFDLLPVSTEKAIRFLLLTLFETNSVYASLQIFAGIALFVVEFALIFSIVGLFIAKDLVIPQQLECRRMDTEEEMQRSESAVTLRAFRKIFLNFANLRI